MMYSEQQEESSSTSSKKGYTAPHSMNPFKKAEKLYKRPALTNKYGKVIPPHLQPKTDFSGVIDFQNIAGNSPKNKEVILEVKLSDLAHKGDCTFEHSDLFSFPEVIYGVKDYPGFYFIPNCFTPSQQLYWISQALEVYTKPPNNTILTSQYGVIDHLWGKWVEEIKTRANPFENSSTDHNHTHQYPYQELMDKLKWATVGYQYLWTPRIYDKTVSAPFPPTLFDLVQKIAHKVGYAPYVPEAGTINFYTQEMVMNAHLDDAEYEMTKPIVSMSFGSEAVFLLGGETKETEPLAMFIRSGDIMIMGGRARFCFHGVSRIVEDSIPQFLTPEFVPEENKWHAVFLKQKGRRININCRQVFSYKDSDSNSNSNNDSSNNSINNNNNSEIKVDDDSGGSNSNSNNNNNNKFDQSGSSSPTVTTVTVVDKAE